MSNADVLADFPDLEAEDLTESLKYVSDQLVENKSSRNDSNGRSAVVGEYRLVGTAPK